MNVPFGGGGSQICTPSLSSSSARYWSVWAFSGRTPRIVDGQRVHDRAVLEDHHPVGDGDGFVDIVGHQQHTETLFAPKIEQQLAHAEPGERIQRAERLVEQQQLRLGHQRPRQRNTLRLTA